MKRRESSQQQGPAQAKIHKFFTKLQQNDSCMQMRVHLAEDVADSFNDAEGQYSLSHSMSVDVMNGVCRSPTSVITALETISSTSSQSGSVTILTKFSILPIYTLI